MCHLTLFGLCQHQVLGLCLAGFCMLVLVVLGAHVIDEVDKLEERYCPQCGWKGSEKHCPYCAA